MDDNHVSMHVQVGRVGDVEAVGDQCVGRRVSTHVAVSASACADGLQQRAARCDGRTTHAQQMCCVSFDKQRAPPPASLARQIRTEQTLSLRPFI